MGGFEASHPHELDELLDVDRYEEIVAESLVNPAAAPTVFVRDGYDAEFEFADRL